MKELYVYQRTPNYFFPKKFCLVFDVQEIPKWFRAITQYFTAPLTILRYFNFLSSELLFAGWKSNSGINKNVIHGGSM